MIVLTPGRDRFLILGCGYTGRRVAEILVNAGAEVVCTNRTVASGTGAIGLPGATALPLDVTNLQSLIELRAYLRAGATVLHSIPSIQSADGSSEATPEILETLRQRPPARLVYLSTTGVYGDATSVDEHTAPAPRTERELLRARAERAVKESAWPSLILRPAAIYGPGRGVHAAMLQGTYRLPETTGGIVSRIHVDDLARHAVAALLSDLTGAFPVADEEPCTSREVAEFTARLLHIPMPASRPLASLGETQRGNRRVDGSAIRRALGIELEYPSYRQGIPASLNLPA